MHAIKPDQSSLWLIFLPFVVGLALRPFSVCPSAVLLSKAYFAALVFLLLASSSWLGWLAEAPLFLFFGYFTATRIGEYGFVGFKVGATFCSVMAILVRIPALFMAGYISLRESQSIFLAVRKSDSGFVRTAGCGLIQLVILAAAAAISFALIRFA